MTNLDHLNVVATVCDTGSFQLASEKLNKARSAVSYSVKQVEGLYQIQIFDRSKYRPELTREGIALVAQIRRLLDQAWQFEDFAKELKGENETELRLGVSGMFPITHLSGLLSELKRDFSSTTIHLEVETASGERQLLAKRVDIAIYPVPTRSPFLDYKQVLQVGFPLLISAKLLALPPQSVSKSELLQHPQVIIKSSDELTPDFGVLDEALKWYVTDLATKKELIGCGLGWGRLPYHLVEKEIASGKLVVLPTLGDLTLPICLSKHATKSLGPVGSRIWSYFSE